MKRTLTLILFALLGACGPATDGQPAPRTPPGFPPPTEQEAREAMRRFNTMRDGFLDWYYEAHPHRSTRLGIHDHDHLLPAMDRLATQRRIDDLLDWLVQLERVPPRMLPDGMRYDYGVLEFAIRGMLLDLEEARSWASDPRVYTTTLASALAPLVERDFAPLAERAAALRARMDAAPTLLQAARDNVRSPPRIWTELAVVEARGLASYVETDLPAALAAQGGAPVAGRELDAARARLVTALQDHARWLEEDLLPRSTGDFRLGPYLFQRKLLYEEHVNLSIEELDRLNERKIAEYRQWVERVAREIDPDRTPREIMDSITRLHPSPGELIPTARAMMIEARDWVRRNDIVTLPTDTVPVVRETPPYARAGFASMSAPGPFEDPGLEAYYNITNVDPAWPEDQQRQHLTYFNHAGLLGITIHETFPGHYVQLLYARDIPSDIRKVFMPRSFVEGWAHYAEQMMLDEGFRGLDPGIRLGQLRRALQRHARWYAGLHLHAMGRSIDEVVARYMVIAYFDEFPARREVVRATYDPTYLYYALGRMQILDLRKDYEEALERRGEAFHLREFHDRLLRLGLPLTLAREAMVPALERPRAPAQSRQN